MAEVQSSVHQCLLYLPDYRVLICRPCKYAVGPYKRLQGHLRREHGNINKRDRAALVCYAKALPLVEPAQVQNPDTGSPPIPGLPTVIGRVCNQCGHTCSSDETMQKHCQTTHGWRKAERPIWEVRSVQTFYQGGDRRFFVVSSTTELMATDCDTISLDPLITTLLPDQVVGNEQRTNEISTTAVEKRRARNARYYVKHRRTIIKKKERQQQQQVPTHMLPIDMGKRSDYVSNNSGNIPFPSRLD
jgi:hypothetical protein